MVTLCKTKVLKLYGKIAIIASMSHKAKFYRKFKKSISKILLYLALKQTQVASKVM